MSDTLTVMDKYLSELSPRDRFRLELAADRQERKAQEILEQTVHAILLLLLNEGIALSRQEIIGQLIIDNNIIGAIGRVEIAQQLEFQKQLQGIVNAAINSMFILDDIKGENLRYLLTDKGREFAQRVSKKEKVKSKKKK